MFRHIFLVETKQNCLICGYEEIEIDIEQLGILERE